MHKSRWAILTNRKDELFAGKLIAVSENGMATIRAIPAMDLLLTGDGPCTNRISRPVDQAKFFETREGMLQAARDLYANQH